MEKSKREEKLEKYIEEMKELQEKLLSFIDSTDENNDYYIEFEELKDTQIKVISHTHTKYQQQSSSFYRLF